MRWSDESRLGRPFAKDPSVIRFGNEFLMYYSLPGRINDSSSGWAMGVASSRDLLEWTKKGEILPADGYESKGLCAGNAIVLNGRVHLFYQTYGNGRLDAICHAVSTDGVRFVRDPTNPVFRPTGNWNCGRAIDAEIFPWKDRLLLYCATRDPDFRVQMLTGAAAPLHSDFGRGAWTQFPGSALLRPELAWEKNCIEAPAVTEHRGKLFLFYAGAFNNEPQQIGCASSQDGIRWQRISDQPFLANGRPGAWNSSESGHPGVVTYRGQTYLFFQGNSDKGKTYFLSSVRVGWKAGRPYLQD